uniref:Uncharacterized protein n=1 Tax=Arundo donax TaxID=35708 RepID=A0A0A9ESV6_ARUDO
MATSGSPPCCGHCRASCATYAGSMVGSCCPPAVVLDRDRRLLKELQWEAPMVWAPDRITISFCVRPLDPKICVSWATFAVGGGRFPFVSDASDAFPSRRPAGTWYAFPPASATLSLAANARMSAQETTPKQACSMRPLMRSITSKPLRLVFGPASFSAVLPFVESISTDASHPLTKQSWKCSRRRPAARPGLAATALLTSCCTMISAAGHELS